MNSSEYDAKGKRISLQVWFPELPPSTNHLYFMGKQLTDEARSYRERFKKHLQQTYGHQLSELEEPNEKREQEVKPRAKQKDKKSVWRKMDFCTKNPNLIYGIQLVFYGNQLTSWGDASKPPSGRARFRFQKNDVSNRIKFVEDCFKWILDIDDSLTFWSQQMKIHSPNQDGVYIHYFVVQPEQFGVPRVMTQEDMFAYSQPGHAPASLG